MSSPTPRSVAERESTGRLAPSDGPCGDTYVDEAVLQVRRSVDALVAGPSVAAATMDGPTPTSSDAGDVVSRAHEAHEVLGARLKQAQG